VTKLIVYGGPLTRRHTFYAAEDLVEDAQREAVRARERVHGKPLALVHIAHGPRCEL
jgi:hypothetical protein